MNKFGYSIHKDNQIDYDANDRKINDFMLEYEPTYWACIACGSCTASCSAGNFSSFNFRKTHLLVRRGETKTLKSEIEKCMFCGKCLLVCPRGVNTRNLILGINKAIEKFGL